jgi:hypothetical protein
VPATRGLATGAIAKALAAGAAAGGAAWLLAASVESPLVLDKVIGTAACAGLAAGAALTFKCDKFDPSRERSEKSAELYHALADRPSAASNVRSSNSSIVIGEKRCESLVPGRELLRKERFLPLNRF